MTPESMLSKFVGGAVALAFGLLGYFVQRTLKKIDHDNEEQRKALESLGGKIDRLADRVSDQVQQVQRDVSALRVEFARELATVRGELLALGARQDLLEKDLNQSMRWVRTEFEGVHAELTVDSKASKP